MADITVAADRYQRGAFPDVCVLTGLPANGHMTIRTPVSDGGSAGPARMLDAALMRIDSRRAVDLLLGRLPVDRRAVAMIQRRRAQWGMLGALMFVVMLASAATAQPWSPAVAGAAAVAVAVAVTERGRIRRRLPVATGTRDGSHVTVRNVHPAFAEAIEGDRPPFAPPRA